MSIITRIVSLRTLARRRRRRLTGRGASANDAFIAVAVLAASRGSRGLPPLIADDATSASCVSERLVSSDGRAPPLMVVCDDASAVNQRRAGACEDDDRVQRG